MSAKEVLILGSGAVSAQLNLALQSWGFAVAAQLSSVSPELIRAFDARLVVVVEPEAAAGVETMRGLVEAGRIPVVIGTPGGALMGWAASAGAAAFPYPPAEADLAALRDRLAALSEGGGAEEIYRRAVLGGDMAARVMAGIAARKIAVTSPKGGTGKSTVAVNLAALLALSGFPVYLADLDANGGALFYHLRMHDLPDLRTLLGYLRRREAAAGNALDRIAAGHAAAAAFNEIPELPTLHVLSGIQAHEVGDPALAAPDFREPIRALFDAAVAAGGILIADVGINPAHPLHTAALAEAEAVAIVIKPEVPDLAQTRAWIARWAQTLVRAGLSEKSAISLVGRQVKMVYNMVIGDSFKRAHQLLVEALRQDGLGFQLVPNGVLPYVDPRLSDAAVNSERRGDILIWRWARERPEELRPFAEALVGFAAHFVPTVREAAAAAGLLPGTARARRILPFGRR